MTNSKTKNLFSAAVILIGSSIMYPAHALETGDWIVRFGLSQVDPNDDSGATALGAAISAAVGCGMFDAFKKAVDTMVNVKKSYQPIAANVQRYERFFREVYVKFYDSVQQHLRTIAEINEAFDG